MADPSEPSPANAKRNKFRWGSLIGLKEKEEKPSIVVTEKEDGDENEDETEEEKEIKVEVRVQHEEEDDEDENNEYQGNLKEESAKAAAEESKKKQQQDDSSEHQQPKKRGLFGLFRGKDSSNDDVKDDSTKAGEEFIKDRLSANGRKKDDQKVYEDYGDECLKVDGTTTTASNNGDETKPEGEGNNDDDDTDKETKEEPTSTRGSLTLLDASILASASTVHAPTTVADLEVPFPETEEDDDVLPPVPLDPPPPPPPPSCDDDGSSPDPLVVPPSTPLSSRTVERTASGLEIFGLLEEDNDAKKHDDGGLFDDDDDGDALLPGFSRLSSSSAIMENNNESTTLNGGGDAMLLPGFDDVNDDGNNSNKQSNNNVMGGTQGTAHLGDEAHEFLTDFFGDQQPRETSQLMTTKDAANEDDDDYNSLVASRESSVDENPKDRGGVPLSHNDLKDKTFKVTFEDNEADLYDDQEALLSSKDDSEKNNNQQQGFGFGLFNMFRTSSRSFGDSARPYVENTAEKVGNFIDNQSGGGGATIADLGGYTDEKPKKTLYDYEDGAEQQQQQVGITDKMNQFIEQNKELLDGPEGENNLGYYRTVRDWEDVGNNNNKKEVVPSRESSRGESYWKDEAKRLKAVVKQKEKEIEEVTAFWKDKVKALENELAMLEGDELDDDEDDEEDEEEEDSDEDNVEVEDLLNLAEVVPVTVPETDLICLGDDEPAVESNNLLLDGNDFFKMTSDDTKLVKAPQSDEPAESNNLLLGDDDFLKMTSDDTKPVEASQLIFENETVSNAINQQYDNLPDVNKPTAADTSNIVGSELFDHPLSIPPNQMSNNTSSANPPGSNSGELLKTTSDTSLFEAPQLIFENKTEANVVNQSYISDVSKPATNANMFEAPQLIFETKAEANVVNQSYIPDVSKPATDTTNVIGSGYFDHPLSTSSNQMSMSNANLPNIAQRPTIANLPPMASMPNMATSNFIGSSNFHHPLNVSTSQLFPNSAFTQNNTPLAISAEPIDIIKPQSQLEDETLSNAMLLPNQNENDEFGAFCEVSPSAVTAETFSSLTPDQIMRYSRQLLVRDGFGVSGQHKLLSSKVLVVGAGGIGSTALLYLAAAGVNITIIDFDTVHTSNLHRQIIHTDQAPPLNKAQSAREAIRKLNPTVSVTALTDPFTSSNAQSLVSEHDCVMDASDNPQTRYLINDACVLAGKPLISGSAMGGEGQMTIYNKGGGCYRCLYPKGDEREGCKSCADNGVLGPVPGLIGILGAMEVIKVLTGVGSTMHDRLLMYDALQCSFLNLKKPPPRSDCKICGSNPTIKTMADSHDVSQTSRGPTAMVTSDPATAVASSTSGLVVDLPSSLSISAKEYDAIRREGTPHVLLDVRVTRQYEICALGDSVNIPLEELEDRIEEVKGLVRAKDKEQGEGEDDDDDEDNGYRMMIYCLCRRGVASAEATRVLNSLDFDVRNIAGGLNAWVKDVDESFPMY